jgi:hypothetical protein
MTKSPDPSQLLRALKADLPTREDEERVRDRLIALGLASHATTGAQATTSAHRFLGKFASSPVGKALMATGLALTLGGTFLLASHRPDTTSSRAKTTSAARTGKSVDHPGQASVDRLLDGQSPKPATTAVRDRPSKRVPRRARPGPSKPQPAEQATTTAADQSTLAIESALLARALEALQRGELAQAAQLLREHESRFPFGVLRHERQLAWQRLRGDSQRGIE